MDSRLIYAASDSLKWKVTWMMVTAESEWTYFGAGDETNIPFVIKRIDEHFPDEQLNVAFGRKDSLQIDKSKLESAIHEALGARSFFIWDKDFKKVMEFNYIGVLRVGHI